MKINIKNDIFINYFLKQKIMLDINNFLLLRTETKVFLNNIF